LPTASAGFCDKPRDAGGRAMSEMRAWLSKNKLEQIAELLEANDIDLDVLPELN
jgi:hypothetical protein